MIIPRQTTMPLSMALVLQGNRLTLRPPMAEDWNEWSSLRGDSRAFLTPWEALWHPDALSDAVYTRRLRRAHADWREDEGYSFHIFAKNKLVGGIGLTQIRRGIAQSGLLGYWIGERYARQGYMTEAVALVLDMAFDKLGLHRVEASCIPDNIASRKLLSNLGFREEGFAHSYLKIAGEWADHILFGITEDEWRARQT
jgi:ribosomal-protein-alanine N-acetyltransferase